MTQVSNFDVLKRMSKDNLDIRLGTDFLGAKAVKAGSQVTMGIAGNVLGEITFGDSQACLLLYNKKQFAETKKALEAETASISFTRQELEVLQSMLEVVVDGTGTYSMLRLPHLVKVHTELLDTFSAAIGRKREQ